MPENEEVAPVESGADDRRGFLKNTASTAMAGGLIAGYGTFATVAGRFLYPQSGGDTQWQFITTVDQLRMGESLAFITPEGAKIVVARQREGDSAADFVALSSVCPHLGCHVHWEPNRNRFFCPCHNGVFDPQGKAIAGPPAKAHQRLARFPLKIEDGLLYIEVSLDSINSRERGEA